jgi:D-cysteine desulfhydrase family pyridoxal phosphate-dependent enzyme
MKEILRIKLAHLPTPVEELKRLTKKLNGPELFIKRDDLTGLAFGGNKIRKLEYLAADALDKGCKTLITAGAIQSNHCRQTAAVARKLGMDIILVLGGDEPEDPEANTYLDVLMGAEIYWTTRDLIKGKLEEVYQQAVEDGLKPYMVSYGGSNPTGAASYAYAFRELLEQRTDIDWIVFATSSGGTQAGLHAGKVLLDSGVKILGISVDEPKEKVQDAVSGLAGKTCELLGDPREISPDEILVNDDYLGGGYAVMGEAEIEAIKLFALEEAVMVDPVYTGRAAAGLIDLVRKGYFGKDEKVLFWHTGGTPVLFADKYRKKLLNF